jgi:hypothetical protein
MAYSITLELVGLSSYLTSVAGLNNDQVQLVTQLMQLVKVSLQRMLQDKNSEHSVKRNRRKGFFKLL